MTPEELLPEESKDAIRVKIVGYAVNAGLPITDWIDVGVGRQILEVIVAAVYTVTRVEAVLVRGFFSLETATDPGDLDPADPTNEELPPAPGFLSRMGENVFGTPRLGETFARGKVLFDNSAGTLARTFAPESLTFTWTANSPPFPKPTYRNTDGGSVYAKPDGGTIPANSDGTLTVPAGMSVILPIAADEAGARSTCPAASLSLTTALLNVTATNIASVIGSDRENASAYRKRCTLAPAAVSPFGPADGYRYIALSAQRDADGNVFYFLPGFTTALGVTAGPDYQPTTFQDPTGTSLGINRVAVVPDPGANGVVRIYLAIASGSPTTQVRDDVNGLLQGIYPPTDSVNRIVYSATDVPITVGSLNVFARRRAGLTKTDLIAAINAALNSTEQENGDAFPTFPIGGYDASGGVGKIYGITIQSIIERAHPAIYRVTGTFTNTNLNANEVATNAITIATNDITIT